MPYIEPEERDTYTKRIISLACQARNKPGHINYIITGFLHECLPAEPNYQQLNEMIGVLECAKLELYRKVLAPYEDTKYRENGSISDLDWEIE